MSVIYPENPGDGPRIKLSLTEFLLARIAEDEAWANAAVQTPGATHWHWVDPETDEPLTPDPFTQEDVNDYGGAALRSVEELRPVTLEGVAPLPDFVVYQSDEVHAGAAGHIVRHDPARVLAECEAKRRIVLMFTSATHEGTVLAGPGDAVGKLLALPYADHPDYREEWRP